MFPLIAFPMASLMASFRQSNLAGQVIVVVLFAGSILAWSLMITKLRETKIVGNTSRRFVAAYRKEPHPAALFVKRQRYEPSPMYRIYEMTCQALGSELQARGVETEDLFLGGVGTSTKRLSHHQIASVRNRAESFMDDQALLLEGSMHLLAICVSAAPLLGLLGTVWGLLDSFGALAGTGSIMLSAVAPGIAGALLTTVVGLVVAIPSAVAYNIIVDRIRRIAVDMDNYLQQLMADIERHYMAEP